VELSDLKAIEKALFQQYYDKIDEYIILLADNDDASDIEQIFGSNDNWGNPVSMEHDFSIKEILDMPTEGEVQMNLPLANTDCVGHNDLCKDESHGANLHGELFCVTDKDSDYFDIDDLF
jgi:hypothetical protein